MKPLTYGTLPTREEFEEAFERGEPDSDGVIFHRAPHGRSTFRFRNDPRVGTCELTCSELWRELERARDDWNAHKHQWCRLLDCKDGEAAGQWCSDVLSVLGWEWI